MTRFSLGVVTVVLALGGCREEAKTEAPEAPSASSKPRSSAVPAASAAAERPDSEAQCHAGMAALLSSLKEPLRIELYASRTLPKVDAYADGVVKLLTKLEGMSHGKLEHRVMDTTRDEAARAAAREAGLQEVSFGESPDGKAVSLARGYLGLVILYGSEKDAIPVLSPDQPRGLEFWVANKIREIRDRADDTATRIGVVANKDEIALTEPNLVPPQGGRDGPNMQGILQQTLPFYKIEPVDLASPIDDTLAGLIVTQSGQDFTDEELARIDEFVMKGRALAVFASAVNLQAWDPKMKATLDTRRLDRLLSGYGVEMRREILFDKLDFRFPVITESGATEQRGAPGLLLVSHDPAAAAAEQTLDSDFVGFFHLEELAFPYVSPLEMKADRQPAAIMRVVARTTGDAIAKSESPLDLSLQKPAAGGAGARHIIAIAIEGKLESAFGKGKSAGTSRVVVVSSAQFLANPFARAGNPPPLPPQMQMMGSIGGDETLQRIAMEYAKSRLTPTILAFKNVLDWMGADERLIACSALLTAPAGNPAEKSAGKGECTKEQMLKLVDSGLTVDEALEVCARAKK